MKENTEGKADAIPIHIENPKKVAPDSWSFMSKNLRVGDYRDVILFIDWPAAVECPEPIKIEVPSLFGENYA